MTSLDDRDDGGESEEGFERWKSPIRTGGEGKKNDRAPPFRLKLCTKDCFAPLRLSSSIMRGAYKADHKEYRKPSFNSQHLTAPSRSPCPDRRSRPRRSARCCAPSGTEHFASHRGNWKDFVSSVSRGRQGARPTECRRDGRPQPRLEVTSGGERRGSTE